MEITVETTGGAKNNTQTLCVLFISTLYTSRECGAPSARCVTSPGTWPRLLHVAYRHFIFYINITYISYIGITYNLTYMP